MGTKGGYNAAQFSHKNPYSQKPIDNRTSRGTAKRKKAHVGGVWSDDDNAEQNNDDNYDDESDGGYGNEEFSFCIIITAVFDTRVWSLLQTTF